MTHPRDERLVVGLVRGLHGLRGEVRVEALTDRPADRFAAGRVVFPEGGDAPLTIEAAEADASGWRLRFAEVPDRTAAEALRGVYLEAAVAPGGGLPRGEYYWHEVIGARVEDVDGTALGEVVDIYRAGGAEVLLVRGPRGELDVPVVRSVVRVFAPKRGEIVVDGEALGLRGESEPDDDVDRDMPAGPIAGSNGEAPEPPAGAEAEPRAGHG